MNLKKTLNQLQTSRILCNVLSLLNMIAYIQYNKHCSHQQHFMLGFKQNKIFLKIYVKNDFQQEWRTPKENTLGTCTCLIVGSNRNSHNSQPGVNVKPHFRNFGHHVDTLILNGLFYARKKDIVMCYYCGGGFHNLTESDNLLKLHAILYGTCPFLYLSHDKQSILDLIDSEPLPIHLSKAFSVKESDMIVNIIINHKINKV